MYVSSWRLKRRIWGKCSCWIFAKRKTEVRSQKVVAVSEKWEKAHVVTLPQGICHSLRFCHLHHHLVKPGKKLSNWLLVSSWSLFSHTLALFRRLDIGHFVLFELFCRQRGGYKYLFLLHENNQRWESGKQSPRSSTLV